MAHGPHIKDVVFTGPSTRFTSRDLNPLQRGILQKCLVFGIYVVSITLFSFLLDRLDKYLYFKIIANAEAQGILGENLAQTVVTIIVGRVRYFSFRSSCSASFAGLSSLVLCGSRQRCNFPGQWY